MVLAFALVLTGSNAVFIFRAGPLHTLQRCEITDYLDTHHRRSTEISVESLYFSTYLTPDAVPLYSHSKSPDVDCDTNLL